MWMAGTLESAIAGPGFNIDGNTLHACGRTPVRVAGEVDTHTDGRCKAFDNQVVEPAGFEVACQKAVIFNAGLHATLAVDRFRMFLRARERFLRDSEERKDTYADCDNAEFHDCPPQTGRILR
jgi:hypothetical protein